MKGFITGLVLFFSLISMNSFAMQDLGTTNISEPTYRGHPEISRAPEFKNNLVMWFR